MRRVINFAGWLHLLTREWREGGDVMWCVNNINNRNRQPTWCLSWVTSFLSWGWQDNLISVLSIHFTVEAIDNVVIISGEQHSQLVGPLLLHITPKISTTIWIYLLCRTSVNSSTLETRTLIGSCWVRWPHTDLGLALAFSPQYLHCNQ